MESLDVHLNDRKAKGCEGGAACGKALQQGVSIARVFVYRDGNRQPP